MSLSNDTVTVSVTVVIVSHSLSTVVIVNITVTVSIRLHSHWYEYKSGYPSKHEFVCIPMVAVHIDTSSVRVRVSLPVNFTRTSTFLAGRAVRCNRDLRIVFSFESNLESNRPSDSFSNQVFESNRPYTTQAVTQPNGLQAIAVLYLWRTRVMYGLRNSKLSTCLF